MKHAERALVEANRWPILEPIEADGQVNPIALSKPVCIAGARARVNLPLNSPQISRAHALFVADSDAVYVRDLASLNGVSVNDSPVREAVLHNGDVVRIGPFSFRCAENFPQADGAEQPHAGAAELRLAADGARIPLTSRTLVIGSREECDFHVSDPDVSPAHAVVFDREGRWFIRDLRSATGTLVNQEQVGEIKLEPGDEIRISKTRLAFAPAAPSEAEAPADEIEASLATGMDELSLAADDSLVRPAEAAEPPAGKAAKPPLAPAPQPAAPRPPDDSAIIPLLEDDEDARPSVKPAPKSVEAEQPPEVAATPPLLDDSSLIPIAIEPEPPEPPAPSHEPQATAEELLASHPSEVAQPSASQPEDQPEAPPADLGLGGAITEEAPAAGYPGSAEERPSAAPAHPGTLDREKAEEAFSELLDELADNVEEVQTVWQDLKTASPDDPKRQRNPGASQSRENRAGKSESSGTRREPTPGR